MGSTRKKGQYHHFIPRFILRRFAHQISCKDGRLRLITTKTGELKVARLSKHFGQVNMYLDASASNPDSLEGKFALLESKAAPLIQRAEKTFSRPVETFSRPGRLLTFTRAERDTLRKFIFLMKYRNSNEALRFKVGSIDDYNGDDKEQMREYMDKWGFKSPKEVWLKNMHAFLDIPMDAEQEWQNKILLQAYPEDARLFIHHFNRSYMAFCQPRLPNDEFLLTENVYGVSEGLTLMDTDTITGDIKQGLWMQWHDFAPLSPKLLVLLRHSDLPDGTNSKPVFYNEVHSSSSTTQLFPEQCVSVLQDMPVRPPATSQNLQATFECFTLDSPQMNLINGLFLVEAIGGSSIVYKTPAVVAKTISAKLKEPYRGFNAIPNAATGQYLEALNTALQSLKDPILPSRTVRNNLDYDGSWTRRAAFAIIKELEEQHPHFMEFHRFLDGTTITKEPSDDKVPKASKGSIQTTKARLQWIECIECAAQLAFFHLRTDLGLHIIKASDEERRQVAQKRATLLGTQHPLIVWFYVKIFRNFDRVDHQNLSMHIRPLVFWGPEDEILTRETDIASIPSSRLDH